jgi:hypothetical protein
MENIFTKKYSPTAGNSTLLFMVFFTIFVIPLFPLPAHRILYTISYTAIFFIAIFSVETKRRFLLWGAIIATITEWMAAYLEMLYLLEISYMINLIFFTFVVSKLIYEIARTDIVNVRVIVEAINGYLLLGFIFTLLVTFVMIADSNAYNLSWVNTANSNDVSYMSESFYYTFVTITTLGYGDIVPKTPAARSLAILISITGQIYIAIIIALLVGKFASRQNTE